MSESVLLPSTRHEAAFVSSYLIGQDAEGHWLAIEEHGLGGGYFVSRDAALRYVNFETSHAPQRCRLAHEPIGLSFDAISSHGAPARRAA